MRKCRGLDNANDGGFVRCTDEAIIDGKLCARHAAMIDAIARRNRERERELDAPQLRRMRCVG